MHAHLKMILPGLMIAALLAAPTFGDPDKPVKIFILAGQSNMVGSGQSDELPAEYQTPPDNVRVCSRQGKLAPLKPQGRFGPEVSFSHALAKAWPDEAIVIVKVAVGGTSALAWSPTWSAEKAKITQNEKQGALYDRLMTQVNALLKQEKGEVVAMLWAQGGRDARYEEAAKDYRENLKKIIDAVRRDLKNPKLPFLLAKTVDAPPARFPHIETVRAAQEEISKEVPFTKLISSEKLAKHRDNIHFNTEGQIELGKRFAKAFLEAGEKSTGRAEWEGTWQAAASEECKELRCRAKKVTGTEWEATFTGVCNKQFSFQVKMKGTEADGKIVFLGKTDLGEENGGVYTWTGEIAGDEFTGQYDSTAGKKGTFTMKPQPADKAPNK